MKRPKKQKAFFEKIEELNGKEGVVELSDEDRKAFAEGEDRFIEKESEKMENFIWFLAGIGIAILGNFVVMLFYDWLKNLLKWQFISLSILIIVLFIMISYIFITKLLEYKSNLDLAYKSRKMWSRAKNIRVGPKLKPIDI
jgi:uncharacterized protein YqhQ